jgi:hypothetical protein
MNSSDRYSQLHEEHTTVPYRPMAITQREQDIITICSYTWSQIARQVRFTFGHAELVYRFAAEFVDVHQLPNSEYGIGEGKEMDWDEHVENFMLSRLMNLGLL